MRTCNVAEPVFLCKLTIVAMDSSVGHYLTVHEMPYQVKICFVK